MTKDVLVTVKGLQSIEAGEPEEVEMVSRGDYYYKNGHHYIFFDEVVEGFTESTRNSIKVENLFRKYPLLENILKINFHDFTKLIMRFIKTMKQINY